MIAALGPHAFVVIASYGAAAVLLGALTLETVVKNRRVRRDLEAAERRKGTLDGR